MISFFYYSGIVAWVALGCAAILMVADEAIDWTVKSFWTKREFLAFAWDRMKKKKGWREPKIVTKKNEL